MVSEGTIDEISKLMPCTSTIVESAYAKIYANGLKSIQWKSCNISGILVLIVERSLQTNIIRLYNPSRFDVLFETELYYYFSTHYLKHNDTFYSFPLKGGQIGLLFSDSESAEKFSKCLSVYSPRDNIFSLKSDSLAIPESGLLNQIKAKILKKKESRIKDKLEISKPYAVQLISRVEWDSINNCYILDSIPKELRKIFIKDSSPEPKKTAEISPSNRKKINKTIAIENSEKSQDIKSFEELEEQILGKKKLESRISERKKVNQTLVIESSEKSQDIKSFDELEEQIMGKNKLESGIPERKKVPSKTVPPNYHDLLSTVAARRKAELDKYISEGSESSSVTK